MIESQKGERDLAVLVVPRAGALEPTGSPVSLAGAEQKLAPPDEIAQRRAATVQLGIPTFDKVAGRTSTGETR